MIGSPKPTSYESLMSSLVNPLSSTHPIPSTRPKHLGRRASKMDLPQLQSAKQRAAHYRSEAEKFRKLADAEPIGRIRATIRASCAIRRPCGEPGCESARPVHLLTEITGFGPNPSPPGSVLI